MAEKKAFTFIVDELELVSFLRDGRGAVEEEVYVDWDITRWLPYQGLWPHWATSSRQFLLHIRFAMRENKDLREEIEKRLNNSILHWEKTAPKLNAKDGPRQQQLNLGCGTRASTDWPATPWLVRGGHSWRLVFEYLSPGMNLKNIQGGSDRLQGPHGDKPESEGGKVGWDWWTKVSSFSF